MAWTWVRPADGTLLEPRPLLDLGTGGGQTLSALAPSGLAVGMDHSFDALRAARLSGISRLVCGGAADLPFPDRTFRRVMAGDLVHHLDDRELVLVLREVRRVLVDSGRLVAWWYATPGREAPDAPRFPRKYDAVARIVGEAGMGAEPLELESTLGSPWDTTATRTVGVLGSR